MDALDYTHSRPGLLPLIQLTLLVSLLLLPLILLLITTARLLTLLPSSRAPPLRRGPNVPGHILIVLGSGGHTTEMFSMLHDLDLRRYNRRTWLISAGDAFSAQRVKSWEEQRRRDFEIQSAVMDNPDLGMGLREADGEDEGVGVWDIVTVPRARRVHQSLWTAPWSVVECARACWTALQVPHPKVLRSWREGKGVPERVTRENSPFPDVVVTNGPGTGVVVVAVGYALRFFDIGYCESHGKMRTVYVESWARVRTLSWSGRLLKGVVDRFLVQWEGLEKIAGGRAKFEGVLVS